MKNKILKFGFPSGAIKDRTIDLFKFSGYDVKFEEKFQKINLDDEELECLVTKPSEIAQFVAEGILDAGISTDGAILESGANIIRVCDLDYDKAENFWGKSDLILAVAKNSKIKTVKELQGKKIITRVPDIAKGFLKKNGVSAEIIPSDMPVNESKIGIIADAIIDYYSDELILGAYDLKPLKILIRSGAVLVASKKAMADPWKKEKIESVEILIKGARLAQDMVGIMLHASNNMMEEVFKVLPALKKPTVTHLRAENWFDVFTVAKKKEVRDLIGKLKKIGCTDIVEIPLTKVII